MDMTWESVAGPIGLVVGPLITWWLGKQERNDKRVAITRELEILKAINPESVEYKKLESQISVSLTAFLDERERKEQTAPIIRRYFTSLTFGAVFLVLTWMSAQDWVREPWTTWINLGRIAAAIIAIAFIANILWILVRLVGAVAYAAIIWVVRFFAKRRLAKAETELRDAVDERDRAVEEQKAAEQVLADALRQRSQASGD